PVDPSSSLLPAARRCALSATAAGSSYLSARPPWTGGASPSSRPRQSSRRSTSPARSAAFANRCRSRWVRSRPPPSPLPPSGVATSSATASVSNPHVSGSRSVLSVASFDAAAGDASPAAAAAAVPRYFTAVGCEAASAPSAAAAVETRESARLPSSSAMSDERVAAA
ncbi:unnamed protein product, partial [Ectocarpus sp. 4 AP-2014]